MNCAILISVRARLSVPLEQHRSGHEVRCLLVEVLVLPLVILVDNRA